METTAVICTYEKIYYTLWETAQRYGDFTQFRVIGNSHDERMIPMLEIGTGSEAVFCLAGVDGTDRQMPELLVRMGQEYCKAYESSWQLEDFYEVRKLLDNIRICLVPLLNPDGFDVVEKGYTALRNPIYRQMLRMQSCPFEEFSDNARGVGLQQNFPTSFYRRRRIHQEPASENETKALIHMFQEYRSRGLLSFCLSEKKIVYYRQAQSFSYNQRNYRLARHLQKYSSCHLERNAASQLEGRGLSGESTGSPEQFYAEAVKEPALTIELPEYDIRSETYEACFKKGYNEIRLLPLEYIYSLNS